MKDQKGYDQAIQNLAHETKRTSDLIPESISSQLPSMEDLEGLSPDEVADVLSKIPFDTDTTARFKQMDEIIDVVAATYEVNLEQISRDVAEAAATLAIMSALSDLTDPNMVH